MLKSISPIDGRYADKTQELSKIFSEFGLIKFRLTIECKYFISLIQILFEKGKISRNLNDEEIKLINSLFSDEQELELGVAAIKEIEKKTNHDTKSVEVYLRKRFSEERGLDELKEYIHFGLTSEDVDNMAWALAFLHGKLIIQSHWEHLVSEFVVLAREHEDTVMLARTHGQSASPTTFGKEINVFAKRLNDEARKLRQISFSVKLGGATGNWSAHCVTYPEIDWVDFSTRFISSLHSSFEHNKLTTQVDGYDRASELFQLISRGNTILLDFSRDMWLYISAGLVMQKPKKGEVGSSTMPHKVNPIDFENAEGNIPIANALFEVFSRHLPVSRWQRDLSGSTIRRNVGVAFAHSLIVYKAIEKGLSKISVNVAKMRQEVLESPEVITEAIQHILRVEGIDGYNIMKDLSRGNKITLEDIHAFVDVQQWPQSVKEKIKAITPDIYIGYAWRLAGIELD